MDKSEINLLFQNNIRYHFLWVISIYGGFIFWYFTSMLISVLLVPAKRPTMDYIDDLLEEDGFKVHLYGFGYIPSYLNKWKEKGTKEQQVFEDSIEPNFIKNDWDKYFKTPEILLENNNPREIFVEGSSFFPDSFGEFEGKINNAPNISQFSDIKPCDFTTSQVRDFPKMPYGWFYPKNSILRRIIDPFLHQFLEGGIFNRKEKIEPDCVADEFVSVNIDFVTVFFVVLNIGISISILTFCVEKIVDKLRPHLKYNQD